ncbi:hypothetical protein [Maribacter arcticus]|uniref:Cytochrome c domain-containing protein n=1 Tax=Maribacter arcticus TaxID=561365 RepID=A0A1T4ZR38_9FLAO|nr:hypothetical protein [Maribacter arcticus]SKB24773.1 hypothetical protein SAMN05660866_00065 [Maribacter arcticus]
MNLKTWFVFLMISIVGVLLALANTPTIFEYHLLENQQSEINKSDEAFNKMMDVLTHQRCMNCHPNDNIPKQGNDRRPHYFGMARGEDDKGFQATNCNTCHNSENNTYSGVPGAPHWSLAPASMGWEGLTRSQIAERLVDKNANGQRSFDELLKHMTEDELVLWAWTPGIDPNGQEREVPPVSKEEFKNAVEYWLDNGAVIPTK